MWKSGVINILPLIYIKLCEAPDYPKHRVPLPVTILISTQCALWPVNAVDYYLTFTKLVGEHAFLFFVHRGRHEHSDYSKEDVSVYARDTRAEVWGRKENSTINYFGFSVKGEEFLG